MRRIMSINRKLTCRLQSHLSCHVTEHKLYVVFPILCCLTSLSTFLMPCSTSELSFIYQTPILSSSTGLSSRPSPHTSSEGSRRLYISPSCAKRHCLFLHMPFLYCSHATRLQPFLMPRIEQFLHRIPRSQSQLCRMHWVQCAKR